MSVALISDIHGNAVALEGVLAHIRRRGVERILCLGDVAMIGPRPAECLEMVRGLGCPVVMGNVDYHTLHPLPPDDPPRLQDIWAWTREQLSEEHDDFLRTFVTTHAEGDWLLCCHGGPKSFGHWIDATTPHEELAGYLEGVTAPLIAGGHTHQPMLRQLETRRLINPGSAGLPFRTPGQRTLREAEYAIVGPDSIEFCRVPFDLDAVYADCMAVGLPHCERWSGE